MNMKCPREACAKEWKARKQHPKACPFCKFYIVYEPNEEGLLIPIPKPLKKKKVSLNNAPDAYSNIDDQVII
jgi:hypothetical protein